MLKAGAAFFCIFLFLFSSLLAAHADDRNSFLVELKYRFESLHERWQAGRKYASDSCSNAASKLRNSRSDIDGSVRTNSPLLFGVAKRVSRSDRRFRVNGREVKHLAAGALRGKASTTVIYVHGRGASRHLAFSDDVFGGNFARLKHQLIEDDGIFVSVDITDFGDNGTADVASVVKHYRKKTQGKLVVACGSMGSFICWKLAKSKIPAKKIDAYIILAGFPDPDYLQSGKLELLSEKKPIFFAHGSADRIYSWRYAQRYSRAVRRESPRYPVRLALYKGGGHGAPLRMIDWTMALKWINKY